MDGGFRVTLLRHGITSENIKRAYIGWTDSPLSKQGYHSLLKIKDLLQEPQLLFSSDLIRSVETAQLLFSKRPQKMSNFREIHFGDWEGKTFHELQNDENYNEWLTDPFTVQPPNGESFPQFKERIDEGWRYVKNKIITRRANYTVIVTHGGVIRYLLTQLSSSPKQFWDWRIEHSHGYQLTWQSERQLQEGDKCTLLRAVPSMENVIG